MCLMMARLHLREHRENELEKIGLAAPQITYVLSELAAKGYDVRTDIYTVAEATEELYKFLKQVK